MSTEGSAMSNVGEHLDSSANRADQPPRRLLVATFALGISSICSSLLLLTTFTAPLVAFSLGLVLALASTGCGLAAVDRGQQSTKRLPRLVALAPFAGGLALLLNMIALAARAITVISNVDWGP